MDAERLHSAIAAVCPIFGVSIGDPANKATWIIHFDPVAMPAQRTAAQGVVNSLDNSGAPEAAEAVRVAGFRADAGRIDQLNRSKTATPAQIRTWVGSNVTTLAQARTVLANILILIALDTRN